ncbi:MAG: hypothetical protein U1F65_10850 [Verrucomicrobiota bacterium]
MNALRWILGSITVLFGGGFVFLMIVGNGFRRSFGASETSPLVVVLPLIGFLMLFAAILFPGSKPLLHTAAVAALSLIGFCLWIIFKEGDVPMWFAVAYLIAWLIYYWLAAWRAVPQI